MTKSRVSFILFTIFLFLGMCFIATRVFFRDNVLISDATAIEIHADTLNLLGIEKEEPLMVSEVERWFYFGPRRRVKRVVSKHVDVEIDVQTKKVVWIMNERLLDAVRSRARRAIAQGKEIKPTRQEAEIIAIAKEYSKRLGQVLTPDIKLQIIQFDNGEWGLGWVRYIGNYQFKDEGMGISIDDLTGKLFVYNNNLTAKHAATEVRISEEKAIRIAKAYITAILPRITFGYPFEISKIEQPNLYIVHPNYFLEGALFTGIIRNRIRQFLPPSNPRLVYSIRFEFHETEALGIPRPIIVWVDAATGRVIGGM